MYKFNFGKIGMVIISLVELIINYLNSPGCITNYNIIIFPHANLSEKSMVYLKFFKNIKLFTHYGGKIGNATRGI